jgi:hypothetical protein
MHLEDRMTRGAQVCCRIRLLYGKSVIPFRPAGTRHSRPSGTLKGFVLSSRRRCHHAIKRRPDVSCSTIREQPYGRNRERLAFERCPCSEAYRVHKLSLVCLWWRGEIVTDKMRYGKIPSQNYGGERGPFEAVQSVGSDHLTIGNFGNGAGENRCVDRQVKNMNSG